jgi:hypothetical protein
MQRSPTAWSRLSIASKQRLASLVDECPKMLGRLQLGAVSGLENKVDAIGHG